MRATRLRPGHDFLSYYTVRVCIVPSCDERSVVMLTNRLPSVHRSRMGTYPTFMTEGDRVTAMLMAFPERQNMMRYYKRSVTLELTLQAEHGVEQRYACLGLEDPLACHEHGVSGTAVLVQVDQEVRLDQNPVVGPIDSIVGVVMPD